MRRTLWSAVCALGLAAFASAQGGGPSFQGLLIFEANGVSADGTIVCGHSNGQAYRWSAATGPTVLSDLPGGLTASRASAVSADGTSIVGSGHTDGGYRAARWRMAGPHGVVVEDLGDLPGGDEMSLASGVSDDGAVVVGLSYSTASGGWPEAFRWTDPAVGGSGMVGLGAPGGVSNTSVARACSADGQRVAGNGETLASPSESILWSGTSLAVLGDLPGGAHQSEAWDITPDGRTIVGQGAVVGGNAAFRWTDPATGGIGFESLGDLPGGSVECLAKAVSADGSVVVGYGTTSSGLRAFIWTEAAGMQLLEKALADQGLALNGWTLSLANDVSADGLTIVGRGEDPFGVVRGWVAQLAPETPDMWTDLGQGLAGLRGTPQLEGSGVVLGGSSFTLTVSGALQFAPPVWVVGLTALGAPFKGGTLVPQPDLIFGGNPTGDFSLTSTWPVGMPTPPELYFQFWIHDPGGPAGFAATNAVKASMP